MSKVSIVVPVYGVEKYIERCAHSLFKQTYHDIEYIFVNDCTKDDSIKILKAVASQYPDRDVKIIEKEKNEGLPQARKTGISSASGDYILNVDSDDWIELQSVEMLVAKAESTGADMVYCDWIEEYEDYQVPFKQVAMEKEAYLNSILMFKSYAYAWNRLTKRELYKNVCFPQYYMLEDFVITTQLIAECSKVEYLPFCLNHYSKVGGGSMSADKRRFNMMQKVHNIAFVNDYLQKKGFDKTNPISFDNMIVYMLQICFTDKVTKSVDRDVFKSVLKKYRRVSINRAYNLDIKFQILLKLLYSTPLYILLK